MAYQVNAYVHAVEAPPISEAMTWISPSPQNRALINLCQAVPSYPPAPALQDHVARMAQQPETSLYTDISGLPELRSALAGHMAQAYGGSVDARDVIVAAGCNQAFCVAMMALAKPGDNVIVPSPYYFNHQMWLTMQGIEVRSIPAIGMDGPSLDPAAAADVMDDRTRAIVLVSPNNPTGAVLPSETLESFFDLARTRRIALVIDETYKDFRDGRDPPHRLFQKADWRDVFVQLYSFSKVYALTGYRVGSIIAGPHLIGEIEKIMDCVAICAPRIGQLAALFGLEALGEWKEEKRRLMASRLTALRAAMTLPGLTYGLVSAGAYFAYVRHPFEHTPGKEVARRLAREHNLLCLPGSMFGPGQERYLRLAFANVDSDLMPDMASRLLESQSAR
jgi:aspartate/methionine/tyrosine aminotransferase